jgi:DNA-binding NtrC family response regulator
MSAAIEKHPDSPPPSERQKSPGKTGKQIRILIVDDEPVMLKMLNRILSKAGYSVASAEHGKVALAVFGREKFDLIISDFNMPPGMNGLELLKALKTQDPSVKVITHAGGLNNEQQAQLKEAGVFGIIGKPANTGHILAVVKSALAAPFENQEPIADNIVGSAKALARIIYVDDNQDTRDSMKDVGEHLGFNIKTASCGKEALELFLKNPAEVIVSDYHMPGMNGLELLLAIKAIDTKAKVIIVSDGASHEERQALLEAGAFRVLQKPVALPLLASTVNEALAEE